MNTYSKKLHVGPHTPRFRLYGPFNCISSQKFSLQLSALLLRSSGLISALLVLATIYPFMKVSLSPDIILCLTGLKASTN